ncbi:MAG: hypothetical protein H6713_04865 [Myxococcales bacterium]|nr:hypothetical protein [Myxococcales bacterium]MCB9749324.1 hypothetical protein [Myxococcales bacterium]
MTTRAHEPARERAFLDRLRALILRYRGDDPDDPDDASSRRDPALARALAEMLETLRRPPDDPDAPPGESLSRADVYRIRISKFVARELPPGSFADRALRRAVRQEARALAELLLGAATPDSPYLDRARERG